MNLALPHLAPPFPLTTPLAASEALDGWLERLARRNALSLNELLAAAGIDRPTRPHGLLTGLPEPVMTELSRRTRTPIEQLDAATLDLWTDIGLIRPYAGSATLTATAVGHERARHQRWRRWGRWSRASGSRFCPWCLRDNGGRWQLRWHLTWSFVCTRHYALLSNKCPSCGKTPRSGEMRGTLVPASPWACCHRPRTSGSSSPRRADLAHYCAYDFRTAPVTPLSADHPLLVAQRFIDDVLDRVRDRGPAATVRTCGVPVPIDHAIDAISALITRFATTCPDLSIAASHTLSPGRRISAGIDYRFDPAAAPIARMADLDADTGAFGIAATAAIDLLNEPTLARAGTALERFDDLAVPTPPSDHTATDMPAVDRRLHRLRTPSAVLNSIELTRRNPDMTTAQRLAFRTANPLPRYPTTETGPRPGRDTTAHAPSPWPIAAGALTHLPTRHIPQSLWPSVLDALPRTSRDTGAHARTMSMLLAHAGTFHSWATIALHLELPEAASRSSARVLRSLADHEHLDETLLVLDRLTETLCTVPPPIDYARRRWIFRHLTTVGRRFRRACHEQDLIATGRRRRYSGLYLWELLTGGDIRQRPAHLSTHDPADHTAYAAFKLREVPLLHDFLMCEAERHLLRHRIDEPISWQPALDPDDGTWLSPPPDRQRRLDGWASPSRADTLRASARDHTRRARNALHENPGLPLARMCAALHPFTRDCAGPHERLAELTGNVLATSTGPDRRTSDRVAHRADSGAWCAPHQLTALEALAAALHSPPLAANTAPGRGTLTSAGQQIFDRLAWTCPTQLAHPGGPDPWRLPDPATSLHQGLVAAPPGATAQHAIPTDQDAS